MFYLQVPKAARFPLHTHLRYWRLHAESIPKLRPFQSCRRTICVEWLFERERAGSRAVHMQMIQAIGSLRPVRRVVFFNPPGHIDGPGALPEPVRTMRQRLTMRTAIGKRGDGFHIPPQAEGHRQLVE